MTDNELRGLILKKYYEKRREQNLHFQSSDFTPLISDKDIVYISDQLAEHGLIHWHPIRTDSEAIGVWSPGSRNHHRRSLNYNHFS